jgi:uncharacterized membrane protein
MRSIRFWEVDTLRGVAIVLMVFYHFVWDLFFFGFYQTNLLVGPWQIFARSIATMFLFVMGVSLTLSYNREVQQTGSTYLFKKYLWRGVKIFGWGLVITVATYLAIGRGFVIFGILHLLGLSIILAYPFLGLNRWFTLMAGFAVIGLGLYLDTLYSEQPWLIWLGIKQVGRSMVDYYPLTPWFGVALIGIFAGYTLYPQGQPRFTWSDLSSLSVVRSLCFLGRHSLVIYLCHQPILFGIVSIVSWLL